MLNMQAVLLQQFVLSLYEPRSEKMGLRGLRPGPTQTGLYSNRKSRGLKFQI